MITDNQADLLEAIGHQIVGLEDQRLMLSTGAVRFLEREGTVEREITLEVLESLRSNAEALKAIRGKLALSFDLAARGPVV